MLVFVSAVLFIVLSPLIVYLLRKSIAKDDRKALQSRDLSWYSAKHPACVQGGKVACHACSGAHVDVRYLPVDRQPMVGPAWREHVCKNCGETLFYSESRNLLEKT